MVEPVIARSRKDEILQAATRVFLASGFYAANIDEVAREAGVSKPTIYKHFESKEELFHDVVMAQSCRFTARVGNLHLQDMPAEEGLKQFGFVYLSELLKPTVISLYRIAVTEAARFPKIAEIFYREGCVPVRTLLAQFLAVQNEKGQMNIPNIDQAVEVFYGMLQRPLLFPVLLALSTPPTEARIREVTDEAVRVMMAGYATKATAAGTSRSA